MNIAALNEQNTCVQMGLQMKSSYVAFPLIFNNAIKYYLLNLNNILERTEFGYCTYGSAAQKYQYF